MRLSPLVPLFIALTTALLPMLFQLAGRKGGAADVYGMPKALRIFLWGLTLVGIAGLLAAAYFKVQLRPFQWWAGSAMGIAFVAMCAYMDRYCVRLTDSSLEVTEFRTERIPYSSISSIEVVSSGRGTDHLVVVINGYGQLVISGYLGYFDDLTSKLKARLALARSKKGT